MMRDLQYMISVMTAARDGKRIEVKGLSADSDDRWRIVQVNQHLVWNWSATDYRIAPEPRKAREWWVYYDDHRHEMRISHTPVMDTESGTYIKVREVIE